MSSAFRSLAWGLLISFIGSLPPGGINLVAVHLAGNYGEYTAIIYAVISTVAELIIVRITLSGMKWIIQSKLFFRILEWVTALMLALFAIICFVNNNLTDNDRHVLPGGLSAVLLTGIIISFLNPFHFPFWLSWNIYLVEKGILRSHSKIYAGYLAGIGMGTMCGFVLYILAGQWVVTFLQHSQDVLYLSAGIGLSVIALLYIRRILSSPVSVRYAKLFRNTKSLPYLS